MKEDSLKLISEKYKDEDRLTMFFLVGFYLFGILIAFFYNTFLIAFACGTFCLLAYYCSRLLKGTTFYQYVLGVVYALFTAQYIYQMHGMLEMHFCAFIGSIMLITYQNWKLQLPLTITVAIHHTLFAWLQYDGNPEIFFTSAGYMPLPQFVMHVGLAVVIFALCGFWAYKFERQNRQTSDSNSRMQQQLANAEKNISFANEISKGNLETEYQYDDGDILGQSLIKMRENLVEAYRKDQQDKFVNVGLAKASELLRQQSSDLESLANTILSFLINYLGVNQGGLFVISEREEDVILELKACYAYDRKKFLTKEIEPGEGLVGQAYIEGETIYLTEVPPGYVNITSGLGTANPRCLVIVPLKINDLIFGVIEIASFTVLEKYKVEFIEKIGESIATSISNVRVNEKTRCLLEDSQQQAEMLRAQEEEMRQNMEELASTQEEMERKAQEIEQIRIQERTKAEDQSRHQKKVMEELIDEFRKTEGELKDKVKNLEKELKKYDKNN